MMAGTLKTESRKSHQRLTYVNQANLTMNATDTAASTAA